MAIYYTRLTAAIGVRTHNAGCPVGGVEKVRTTLTLMVSTSVKWRPLDVCSVRNLAPAEVQILKIK
jgi:hypothetical protein